MKKKILVGALLLAGVVLIVASCDEHQSSVAQVPATAMQPVQSPAPVIVQQSSNDGFWQGMMLGHLFGSRTEVVHRYDSPRSSYVAPARTTVQNTTIVNKTVVQSAPRPSSPPPVSMPSPARPSTPTASFSPPPRATSYSGSYSSRPSYSSYSSRASFSSSGRR